MAYQGFPVGPVPSSTGKTTQYTVYVADDQSGAVHVYAVDVRHVAALAAALAKLGNGEAQS